MPACVGVVNFGIDHVSIHWSGEINKNALQGYTRPEKPRKPLVYGGGLPGASWALLLVMFTPGRHS